MYPSGIPAVQESTRHTRDNFILDLDFPASLHGRHGHALRRRALYLSYLASILSEIRAGFILMAPDETPTGSKDVRTGVFVVDDHPAIRLAVRRILAETSDLHVTGEAESGGDALKAIEVERPEVVVVDLSLTESHGLELISQIRERFPGLPIVVYSMYPEDVFAERAIRAGAHGYVMKTAPLSSLVECIRASISGEVYLSRKVISRMLSHLQTGHADREEEPLRRLTDREIAVFQMIAEGHDPETISTVLRLDREAVEHHRRDIRQKLGLDSDEALRHYAHTWRSEHL